MRETHVLIEDELNQTLCLDRQFALDITVPIHALAVFVVVVVVFVIFLYVRILLCLWFIHSIVPSQSCLVMELLLEIGKGIVQSLRSHRLRLTKLTHSAPSGMRVELFAIARLE